MIAVIAALSFIQKGPGLPASFVGLWADRNDRAYLVCAPRMIEFIDGMQWGMFGDVYQAPNNDFVGVWAQSKSLTVSEVAGLAEQGLVYGEFRSTHIFVPRPDNAEYGGEFRAKLKGDGRSLSPIDFTLKNQRGNIQSGGTLYYLGGYNSVTVGGTYSDKYTSLQITEEWGQSNWQVSGKLTHLSKSYIAKGERLFTRGILDLVDPTTGKSVGRCVYGYAPSAKQIKEFRGRKFSDADQLLLNFNVPGSPTMQSKIVAR